MLLPTSVIELSQKRNSSVTHTFKYDTYGRVVERTGESFVIFGYNGRDGVVTDKNGLIYMRARYYSPEMRRFVNADILHGEISNAITLNRYAYANGNPVSNVDPFGLSAERGANNSVISGLEGLYNLAYEYYNYVYNDNDRINFANDAVMKYIIYDRFYKASKVKGLAWGEIAGTVDYGALNYLESSGVYNYMQGEINFYDLSSGDEIDFVHLIATLNANTFDRPGLGFIDKRLNDYAGWAGDLITLAGDAQAELNRYPKLDIVWFVKESLANSGTSFSHSDLLADIDAVLLSQIVTNKPIYQAFDEYYSSDTSKRFATFVEQNFDGAPYLVEEKAVEYLSPGIFTNIFKSKYAFDSNYSKDIINKVAGGFYAYIIENL